MSQRVKMNYIVSVVEFHKGRKFLKLSKTVEGHVVSSLYFSKSEVSELINLLKEEAKNL